MSNKTFKILRQKEIADPLNPLKKITVRRWKTLIDRPEFNVKKGDLTGFIDSRLIPSEDEEAWFGYDTIMYGRVHAGGRIHLRDKAIVRGPAIDGNSKLHILGNVVIGGNAIVGIDDEYNNYDKDSYEYKIAGHTKIIDNARIGLPKLITGNVTIRDTSVIGKMAEIIGDVEIYDQAVLGDDVSLKGHIHVHENSKIGDKASVFGELNIDADTNILSKARIQHGVVEFEGVLPTPKRNLTELPKIKHLPLPTDSAQNGLVVIERAKTKNPKKKSKANSAKMTSTSDTYGFWIDKANAIKESIDSYTTDIVKIIKFPVMVDLTDSHTAEMVFALKDLDATMTSKPQSFIKAATQLERKFLIAESNARKIAATTFTEDELKKTQQAKDLFALACHEGTNENEKKKALKQGFRRLEGIIAVPNCAVEAMRVKVGIAEIEM